MIMSLGEESFGSLKSAIRLRQGVVPCMTLDATCRVTTAIVLMDRNHSHSQSITVKTAHMCKDASCIGCLYRCGRVSLKVLQFALGCSDQATSMTVGLRREQPPKSEGEPSVFCIFTKLHTFEYRRKWHEQVVWFSDCVDAAGPQP